MFSLPPRLCACRVALLATATLLLGVAPAIAQQNFAVTTQQPVFGVMIDADGVLQIRDFTERDGRLHQKRIAAAQAALQGDVLAPSPLRKVSLVRLERAIVEMLEQGHQPYDVMQNLAGLQRLQYVFFLPEENDVVVAGPAEGWVADAAGRVVGITTGRPVLKLVDLLVALRAYPPGRQNHPYVGCSIDPTPAGMTRLAAFQKTIPRSVSQRDRDAVAAHITDGSRDAIGMRVPRVFGIPDETRFAHVMLEADYRMKRIGIGVEPPPVKMHTFVSALRSARHGIAQRWWFQPDYDCVKVTEDRLAMELVGQGVQLLGEDRAIGPAGNLINPTAKANNASTLFTGAFTRKYPLIAEASPAFAELRNLIDMLVAAAFIEREDYYGRAGWSASTLSDEAALPTRTLPAPRQVPPLVNALWKGSRLFAPTGGVSIHAHDALSPDRLLTDEKGKLRHQYDELGEAYDTEHWWWD